MLDFNDPGQVEYARQVIKKTEAALEILIDKLSLTMIRNERYVLIAEFCQEHGDQYDERMGEEAEQFFCFCGELLPMERFGHECYNCERWHAS